MVPKNADAALNRRGIGTVCCGVMDNTHDSLPQPGGAHLSTLDFHRGAGKSAPENTLSAFRLGAAHGFTMFECDVKLSTDDPFLLHDDALERTTNGRGPAAGAAWADLSRLDAGAWHSSAYAGEPLLRLEALAR